MSLFNRILVPFDFSPCCRAALGYANVLAERFDAEITLLHVQATPPEEEQHWPGETDSTAQVYETYQSMLKARAEATRERLAEATAHLTTTIHTRLQDGAPHDAILTTAAEDDFDLIVMGTHGRTGWRHMFMGSTAERVIREASIPVLTIRRPDDEGS